ncbi:selenide, water dikinase SelD [Amphiplicatus metriothermophilus]|uniref:Selenide, water dikinase n=1 Tax=Amphiplicatus metriothermophilus TaxID=1519374 RepID=A0A239PJ82_9PROT|nr:selenide, water dikinase SelD [Amphiplicatus metriothermophilus]MBB5517970.1 selenide,water dikinase [Amphiplicatus metriothermophilus]SNT67697.1 selenophosphate synthase [Amphiplicatus metriothermophilus]
MTAPESGEEPCLTALAHGGGCGCKLAPDVLRELLSEAPLASGETALLVDAATSDDAAVYRLTDDLALVATTDFFTPIVDDPYDFGRIAATNALSDVYAMGGRPIFALALVGMPIDKLGAPTIRKILAGGRAVCDAAGAPIAGGHSIDAAEPIYGLAALGLVNPKRILRNSGARADDALVLGKPLGIGILSAALKRGVLDADSYRLMIESTTRLNTPGVDLASVEGVHAATDVTGFGLLGHLLEICRASGLAAEIDSSSAPVFPAARALADTGVRTGASARNWRSVAEAVDAPAHWAEVERDLFCDPQTSGGLLVACAPESVETVLEIFARHGHGDAAIIGRLAQGAPQIAVR